MKANRAFVFGVLLGTCCTALAWTAARGIDYTWNVGSGGWGTHTNWNPNGVPGTGDVVLLTNGGTIDLGGSRTVSRVGTTGAGNGIVGILMGGSLHFTTNMYVRSGTMDVNLSNAGGSSGRLWIGGDTGAIVLLSGNNTHTFSDNYATIIGHSTTGPAGTVRLGGNNALGGTTNRTDVYSGTLDLNGQNAVVQNQIRLMSANTAFLINSNTTADAGTAANVVMNAANSIGGAGNMTLSGVVSGGGNPTKVGAGTLTLSGDNTFSGTLSVTAGTLSINTWNNNSTAGPLGQSANKVQLNGGTIQYTGGNVGPNKSLNMAGAGTVDVVDADTVLNLGAAGSNSLTGNGDITKEGLGTLQLAQAGVGQSTWGGKLIINAGTVDFFGSDGMPKPASFVADAVQINDGGTFAFSFSGTSPGGSQPNTNIGFQLSGNAGVAITAGTHTLQGVIADKPGETGNLVKSGAGTLVLSGDNTYSGTTTITAGTLRVGAGGTTGTLGDGSIVNNSALVFHRSDAMTLGQDISGSGWLAKEGAGTLTLTGNNTYLDTTTISAGTLEVGEGGTTGTLGPGNIVNNATLRVNRSDNVTLSNNISGGGSLVKVGANTLILTGDNTYNGTTTISGTLQIGTGGAAGTIGSGNIVNNGALAINRSGDVVLAQDISGSGTLTKEGSGTLTLAGATNHGGSTYINNGIVLGALNFRNNLYIKSGTVNANLSNTGYTNRRVWIGGDAGATVTLGGDNTYSFVDGAGNYSTIIGHSTTGVAGTVKLGSSTALGDSANRTHVYSGTLDFNGTVGLAQDRISLLGANAVLANSTGAASTNAAIYLGEGSWGAGGNISVADGASLTLSGLVTSSAPTHPNLNKLGPGSLILTNSANSYNGTTNINAGILGIASTDALPGWNTNGRYSVAPAAILAVDYTQFDANAVAMLDTGNFQSGASIGRMFNTTPGSFTHGADMADAVHGSGVPTALVKVGPNTLTLTGHSTYTGPTFVGGGTLLVNGSTHAGSAVTVRPGATLGGTGTVGGPTTIQGSGTLATGNSIGTLNFGSPLTLNAGAVWDWQFVHKSPGNYDQADGPRLVLPTAGAVTFNIYGLPGHSVFPGDKFTVFTGDVENFSPERVALVNHSKWTSWQMSTGGSLVLTADPTISLSTDVMNAGQANPGLWNTRGDGYSNTAGVELVRFVDRFSTSLDAVAYTQAGTDTIDVSDWVVTSGSGGQRGASQGLQVNGYSSSNTAHTNPGGANPQNLYLRGEANEYNEGFGAHANWIVTFDLDVIREEHFTGTRMPFQLTGEFGTWGGIGSTGSGDGVIQGAIFLDGVRIDDMDPSIANPQASIRNLEFDLTIYSGRYLTFGIFNEAASTSWDDGVFKNVHLTMIPEPGTWLMLLGCGAAWLLVRRRRKR